MDDKKGGDRRVRAALGLTGCCQSAPEIEKRLGIHAYPFRAQAGFRKGNQHEVRARDRLLDLRQPFLTSNQVLAIHPEMDALPSQIARDPVDDLSVRPCIAQEDCGHLLSLALVRITPAFARISRGSRANVLTNAATRTAKLDLFISSSSPRQARQLPSRAPTRRRSFAAAPRFSAATNPCP